MRWRAVDHCVRSFLHITESCPKRQASQQYIVQHYLVNKVVVFFTLLSFVFFLTSSAVIFPLVLDCVIGRRVRLFVFSLTCR